MIGSYFSTDTIVAIATSLAGDAGVGIIRVSGPDALDVVQALCPEFKRPEPRFLTRIQIKDPSNSAVLDDGLAVYFSEGNSFTGEDVVELQLHGGRFLLQAILNRLISTGRCRLALAGEFSFRAVKNGKMSLAGASAVGQLIQAKSIFEVQAARRSLGQARVKEFDVIANKLRDLIAQMELSIDFIDQDVEVISKENLLSEIETLSTLVEKLLLQMECAQRIARGLSVTLLGEPNAGKSTLFNALLTEDRAIVSAEAGTTRDVITEEIRLDPYYLRLADTAGLRDASGEIEREGISRAKELAESSDLVLLVIDATQATSKETILALQKLSGISGACLAVLNKWDLLDSVQKIKAIEVVKAVFSGPVVSVSALQSQGLGELFAQIRAALDAKYGLGLQSFLPTEFQLQMLLECRNGLTRVLELIRATGLTNPELISVSLRSAVKALSDLVGDTTPDTVLTKIFSEFCIGK